MKAKLFAVAIAAAGLAWMANGLANNDRRVGADSSRTSAYVASAEERSTASSSSPGNGSKTDRRDDSESNGGGMGVVEGMKNMMGRMMNGGMMSSGTDGCPMMGGSRPNNQWRDGGSAR